MRMWTLLLSVFVTVVLCLIAADPARADHRRFGHYGFHYHPWHGYHYGWHRSHRWEYPAYAYSPGYAWSPYYAATPYSWSYQPYYHPFYQPYYPGMYSLYGGYGGVPIPGRRFSISLGW